MYTYHYYFNIQEVRTFLLVRKYSQWEGHNIPPISEPDCIQCNFSGHNYTHHWHVFRFSANRPCVGCEISVE